MTRTMCSGWPTLMTSVTPMMVACWATKRGSCVSGKTLYAITGAITWSTPSQPSVCAPWMTSCGKTLTCTLQMNNSLDYARKTYLCCLYTCSGCSPSKISCYGRKVLRTGYVKDYLTSWACLETAWRQHDSWFQHLLLIWKVKKDIKYSDMWKGPDLKFQKSLHEWICPFSNTNELCIKTKYFKQLFNYRNKSKCGLCFPLFLSCSQSWHLLSHCSDFGYYRKENSSVCVEQPDLKGKVLEFCLHGKEEQLQTSG